MKEELIELYREFLTELNNYNEGNSWLNDYKEPTFELFMKWLIDREN